jgi:glycosyltransferase involved in cell wall biosynthesis
VHVLFVHKNFPAQFGHIGHRLATERGWRASFVSERSPGRTGAIDRIMYRSDGGATERTHYCARSFENGVWHAAGVYDALKPFADDLRPDLIVGHSGFGSTLFLKELWPDVPVINYFEYFYRSRGSDLYFRPDQPVAERDRLRSRARNAMILLDLEYCDAGYSPTEWQRSLLPTAYRDKIRVLHDGIDTDFWQRRDVELGQVGDLDLGESTRVVTYVSRGLESMRGFDIFMKVAKRVCDARPDVVFLVVAEDRVAYGGDARRTGGKSFKEWVLDQDDYDLDRIRFVGRVPPSTLVDVLSVSDLHIYLTVPFVLSWSLLDAMACECVVLASDTAPVAEVVEHERTGLTAGFFDIDGLTELALRVLDDPRGHRRLGRAARELVLERYSLDVALPRITSFYESVATRQLSG